MKLEKLTPGMVVHSYGRQRDAMRTKCSWPVKIVEVDLLNRRVLASWNHNHPQWWPEYNATKWRKISYYEAERIKAEKKSNP